MLKFLFIHCVCLHTCMYMLWYVHRDLETALGFGSVYLFPGWDSDHHIWWLFLLSHIAGPTWKKI